MMKYKNRTFTKIVEDEFTIVLEKMRNFIGDEGTAYILMFANALGFTIAMNFIKLQSQLTQGSILLSRGLWGVLLCSALLNIRVAQPSEDTKCQQEDKIYIKKRNIFKLVVLRIILIAIVNLIYGLMVAKLQLSTVIIVINTGPISVMIFNAIIYKIRITRLDVIGTIIAFLGLSVVINPAMFSFSGEELKIESERFVYAEGLERYLCILFLFSACTTWAYSTIMVRQMRGEISTIQLTLYQSFSYVVVGQIHATYYGQSLQGDFWEIITLTAWSVLIGMFFFIAQISFFKSIDMATNIGRASMINYSQVAIGYFIEIFFYGEVPRILQGFGVVAIIFGLGLIMLK